MEQNIGIGLEQHRKCISELKDFYDRRALGLHPRKRRQLPYLTLLGPVDGDGALRASSLA
eukprot:6190804-Pleurochrysis_carterae.AAC.1